MPQIQLPIFPTDSVHITPELAFKNEMGTITYFNGSMPVFSHDEKDLKAFRMITSQFYVNGNVSQVDIARAFGVSIESIKRSVKLYRSQGIDGFYALRKGRGPAVLTEPVLAAVQKRLDNGQSVSEIATEFSLKSNTLLKAIQADRLHAPYRRMHF